MNSSRVVGFALALNVALCAAHVVVWSFSGSELVLAQAADSLLDLAGGVVLLVSVRVSSRKPDENHPFGHQRAEPIGALVTAVLAFVLAVEVGRAAILSLWRAETADVDAAVFGVLGVKFVVKLGVLVALLRRRRQRGAVPSQAVRATQLDTVNDVLTTAASLVGALLVRSGFHSFDGWLALLVGASIARNGWILARGSVRYRVGEAPDAAVLERLKAAAAAANGVRKVRGLRAHFVGSVLHVGVVVLIAAGSTAKQSHDIALDVQRALERDPLVNEVFVHIDTGEGKDGT